MTRDDIIRMMQSACDTDKVDAWHNDFWTVTQEELERFAALVAAAEREKVARWMISKSYATGHGDTVEDLLKELEWQVAEREREACAKVCDEKYEAVPTSNPYAEADGDYSELIYAGAAQDCADAIRARGEV